MLLFYYQKGFWYRGLEFVLLTLYIYYVILTPDKFYRVFCSNKGGICYGKC